VDFSNKLSIQELDKIRESFVANVSHELRTPLTVLRGYLEELIELKDLSPDHWPDSADWQFWGKAFDRMGQQVERMQQLVEDLLLLASIESAALNDDDLEEIDMNLFLDAMVSDAKSISNNKHEFLINIDSSVKLKGKSHELNSAFSNLLINAVRYTPDGGIIEVKWYQDSIGKHFIVKDSGIGISEKDISRITERFYRVDKGRSRNSGGTGLGLSIVKHVLIRHKANLAIESEIGVGSVFRCDFD
jgi:two-component system phosphate regulon sensor histidine kinase PhoR